MSMPRERVFLIPRLTENSSLTCSAAQDSLLPGGVFYCATQPACPPDNRFAVEPTTLAMVVYWDFSDQQP